MKLAIVYPGDHAARRNATADNNRFADLFAAFTAAGVAVAPAVYHDDFAAEVRQQLLGVDGALVWVNPIQDGRDRTVLDDLLRDVAAAGVFVSAHPDVILKYGTKEVLYTTRHLGWGSDVQLYRSLDQMQRELPARLAGGRVRVLKQYRGNGGDGVWKVQLPPGAPAGQPTPQTMLLVRHARRGAIEESITLGDFLQRCAPYFTGDGRLIDQEYQARLTEGMVRCYLVGERVAGFGLQAVNALYPAPPGATPDAAPQPGPRLYHPPTLPEYQSLRQQLEREWLPAARRLLDVTTADLPILWDCDFLRGPRDANGTDTWVLCEINVSSVAPYPESAVPLVVAATVARLREAGAA